MLPRRLDILIAFKAISLAPNLSVTDKRVASALVDHFNKRTRQCDPSLDTLATLLGIHRRTVIRSVNRLVRSKFFGRTRHGGNFHRNFYEPHWSRFREIEAEWQCRRSEHSRRFREAKLSRWQGQAAHPAGDESATQTCLRNLSNETLFGGLVRDESQAQHLLNDSKGLTNKEHCSSIPNQKSPMFHVNGTRSRDAAYAAAERRWNTDLQNQYAAYPEAYCELVDLIDEPLQRAATDAELRQRSAGLRHILTELDSRRTKRVDTKA